MPTGHLPESQVQALLLVSPLLLEVASPSSQSVMELPLTGSAQNKPYYLSWTLMLALGCSNHRGLRNITIRSCQQRWGGASPCCWGGTAAGTGASWWWWWYCLCTGNQSVLGISICSANCSSLVFSLYITCVVGKPWKDMSVFSFSYKCVCVYVCKMYDLSLLLFELGYWTFAEQTMKSFS